jgi:phage shock protein C
MAKQLFRSTKNKKIAGVCGGLGEYFSIDPVWLRAGFLLSILFGGLGLILYLILWALTPYRHNTLDQ